MDDLNKVKNKIKNKKSMKNKKSSKKIKQEKKKLWYFPVFVILVYLILALINPQKTLKSLATSGTILLKLVPVFLLVVFLMVVLNYFLNPRKIVKYLGRKNIYAWFAAILAGILSHGPVYVWYPFLGDLMKHGARPGLVSVFLYNRAVKVPLLPVMIYYFGLVYVAVLMLVMIIASVFQGLLIDWLVDKR